MSDRITDFRRQFEALRHNPDAVRVGLDNFKIQQDILYTYNDFDAFLPSVTGVRLLNAYKNKVSAILTPAIGNRLKRQCDAEPSEGKTVAGRGIHWLQELIEMVLRNSLHRPLN